MSIIEFPPQIRSEELLKIQIAPPNEELSELVNEAYAYWDKVKYKKLPEGYTHKQLWTYVKASRSRLRMNV